MASMMVSDEDVSLDALLQTATSVLTAKQDISRKHPKIKKPTKHKKKPTHAVSKDDKGAKQGIDQLQLDWTEDEDDDDTCNIENIPPVKPRDSERQELKSLHNMISFSSDSDSSPVKKQPLPQVFHQQHQQLTDERTILQDCQAHTHSSHTDTRSPLNMTKGNEAKVKRSDGKENKDDVAENDARRKEIDTKMKNDNIAKGATNKLTLGRKSLCSFSGSCNVKLHALFDSSDSSSESEVASASVLSVVSGGVSDNDSGDFVELSHKLEQLLSLSTTERAHRKQPKKPRNETKRRRGRVSPGCIPDQHDTSSKGDSSKECSSSSVETTSSKCHVETGETPSPVGMDDTGVDDISVTSDTRPETKEISLQVSMSSDGRTSPDTTTDRSVLNETSTEDDLSGHPAGSASPVFSDEAMKDGSCSAAVPVDDIREDRDHKLCQRDLSLQVSLGSTEFSESESPGSDKSGNDHTDSCTSLPTASDFSLQVSVTSTDSSQVSSDGVDGERVVDNDGSCVPSESSSSCEGDKTSGGDSKLKKKLFPRWTVGGLKKKQNEQPSLLRDSGIGATGGKRMDGKLTAHRSEGASYIDLCEDDTDTDGLSSPCGEGSHVTTKGSAKVKEDKYQDDDWLPDLDSSSGEDDLEEFFHQMKTPKVKKPVRDLPSMDVFIVNDSDVSSDDDSALYVTAIDSPPKYSRAVFCSICSRHLLQVRCEISNGQCLCHPECPAKRKAKTTVKKPVSTRHHDLDLGTERTLLDRLEPVTRPHSTGHQRVSEASFLRSLDQQMDNARRHPEAARYVRDFKKLKEDLTTHLFRLYNKSVFAHKLPEDMSITWNKRLIKTAGFCAYSKRVATPAGRNVRIELSVKVCDTAERVRDTLIHELCHAAVWFLNGVNDGHGSYWKYWAHAACRAHPELPPIKRCHKYEITHKYTYKCTKCGYEIGRHSKSLDTKAKVCGYCRSPFALVTKGTGTPRTPNKFALFVKDNYGSVKRDNKAVTHQDVMRILSSDFARQNSISSSGGGHGEL